MKTSDLWNLLTVGMFLILMLVSIFGIEVTPEAGEPVAVIVNPWGSASALEIIAAARGLILRSGRWPWIAVATSDDGPLLQERLKAAGAWLLLSPVGLGTCFDTPSTEPASSSRSNGSVTKNLKFPPGIPSH
jgi:hypothetical protein